jgi:predicted DNA-binding protein (UPF0278 family)
MKPLNIFFSIYLCMNIRSSSQLQETFMTDQMKISISKLIEECNNESDIDKKSQLFYRINSILPSSYQVSIPSLITDDYIDTTLYRIHQNMQIANAMEDLKALSD